MSADWRQLPRDEWVKELQRDCPVFCGPGSDLPNYGLSIWGGWYPILRKGLLRIEPFVASMPADHRCYASQIKQKLGTLRIHTTGPVFPVPLEIRAIIEETEAEANVSCEDCGQPGNLDQIPKGGLICVVCPTHKAERLSEAPAIHAWKMNALEEMFAKVKKESPP